MSDSPMHSDDGPFRLRDHPRSRPLLEMARVLWDNRDHLPYAWRILNHGVCEGCSLGPRGPRDDVIAGPHLCMTRLQSLRLNTMGPIPDDALRSLAALRAMSDEQLRLLGRLPYPMIHRAGSDTLHRLSWDEALGIVREHLKGVPPERMGFCASARGPLNETYYAFQKAARLLGTNHVDLCVRQNHATSMAGLKDTLGMAAPTCSLSDVIGAERVVVWGAQLADDHPVAAACLARARRHGTRILVVNPMREPGLEHARVPGDVRGALFDTRLMDDFFPVRAGGDIAFLHGVMKHLIERDGLDRGFVERHTAGLEDLKSLIDTLGWRELESASGQTQGEMQRFADQIAKARSCVFLYGAGLTQHPFGVDNVKALVNLALARGMLGREKCGILPLGGDAGVRGGFECGVDPDAYPGHCQIASEPDRRRYETLCDAPLPAWKGHRTRHMLNAASRGELDFLYVLGANLLEALPDAGFMSEALGRVRLRLHQDTMLNTSALLPGEAVLWLPAQTRHETRGGGTVTSAERRIRYSPEIPGPRIPDAHPEWKIPLEVAIAARPALAKLLTWDGPPAIRREMARAMPLYAGVESLEREDQSVQWGGERLFADGFTHMPGGRARFSAVPLPGLAIPPGMYCLSARRGPPLMGRRGRRDYADVRLHPADAAEIGVAEGEPVRLRSEYGEWTGRARLAPIKRRHLQAWWPEIHALISRRVDPVSGEPDYTVPVTAEAMDAPGATTPARVHETAAPARTAEPAPAMVRMGEHGA